MQSRIRSFQELESINSLNTDIQFASSKKFRVIRFLLRLLSLWRPRSAGFFESYVYPAFVNILLLTTGPIRNSLRATSKSTWLSIQVLYIVHEIGVWLGHMLANRYFASRDLETNVLSPAKPLTGWRKHLHRRLNVLNIVAVISMTFFSIILCTLFVVTRLFWNEGDGRFSAELPNVHGPIDHILYCFIPFSIIYNLGVGLALSWTLALLYSCYAARLKILENYFLKWKHSSVDAVSLFLQVYARPVKKSWKGLSWWFLAHNIVALTIPLYGYELAQAVSGQAYNIKHLPQFICYFIFILSIWLTPTVIGELIKGRERKFFERINEICPWLLEAEREPFKEGNSVGSGEDDDGSETRSLSRADLTKATTNNKFSYNLGQTSRNSIGSTATEGSDNAPRYSFVSRGKELGNFLRFLKRRTPGLVSRGYSLQLNLSLISLTGGAIWFLTDLQTTNSKVMMHRDCNCSVS